MGFALRHEDLDLLVLKRLFQSVPEDTVTAFVRGAPTGAPHRRAWFLYEFLTGRTLDIPDAAEASCGFRGKAGAIPKLIRSPFRN